MGAAPAFFVPTVDFLHIKFLAIVQVFRLAFPDHGNRVKTLLLLQGQYGLWCEKPAVKQDIFGCNTRTLGGMDQLHHDIGSLAACLQASFPGKGASVTGSAITEKVLVLRSG